MYIIVDSEEAAGILAEAKSYTDAKVSEVDVSTPVTTHDTSTSAHSDIRASVSAVEEKLNWITF